MITSPFGAEGANFAATLSALLPTRSCAAVISHAFNFFPNFQRPPMLVIISMSDY